MGTAAEVAATVEADVQDQAAMRIEAVTRGGLARRRSRALKTNAAKSKAAVRIEAVMRGGITRRQSRKGAKITGAEEVTESEEHALPAPWEELYTDEGQPYYHNTETGTTSWERPVRGATGGLVAPKRCDGDYGREDGI